MQHKQIPRMQIFSELDKTAQMLNLGLTELVSTTDALKRSMEAAKSNASMLVHDPVKEPSQQIRRE